MKNDCYSVRYHAIIKTKRDGGARKMGKNNEFEIDGGWVGVAICLAVCWPIGLLMLWRKVKQFKRGRNETAQMAKTGTSLVAAGLGMTVFGLPGWGIPTALIGGGLVSASRWSRGRERRYKRYLAIIGGRPSMSIYDIAAAIPVPAEQAVRELQNMIDLGFFGMTTYIDRRSMRIVLDGSAPQSAPQQTVYVDPEPENVAQPVYEEKQDPPVQEEKQEKTGDDQFGQWISAIREVNDRIADEVISAKIDRIERLTARIFELVRSRPDKQPQIRKFMNYYLPTTLKLLDSYALLEAQGIEGDNISASKKQIESIMDTLIQGFEKQLDLLFTAQKMDINSDIEVLESMMAADGLTENEFQLPRGGH